MFQGYLSSRPACEGAPRGTYVVLLGDVRGRAAAEGLVAAWVGKLVPGYPLVLAQSELPIDAEDHEAPESALRLPPGVLLADLPLPSRPSLGTLRVVAGFFASERAARKYAAEALGGAGTVHPIAGPPRNYPTSGDYLTFKRSRGVAVAIAHPAPAYAPADLARVETAVGARKRGEDEEKIWETGLARLKPACSVRAGQVFETNEDTLYEYGRRFAPVECGGGRIAWVPWQATRLESVVRVEREGVFSYQVVDVMCDTAAIDRTPFVWAAPLAKGPRPRSACGRGRS